MKDKDREKKKPNGQEHSSAEQSNQPTFVIQRLYTKAVAFDAPNLPSIFGKEWKPQLDVNIQNTHNLLGENMHEVELQVTINGKLEEKQVFTLEIKQAGIFYIENFNKEQQDFILGSECLKILYPYAREAITDLTSRGTLPQLYLTPINFDAVYAQQKNQASDSKK